MFALVVIIDMWKEPIDYFMIHSPVSINELNEIINQIAINIHFDFIFSSHSINLIENWTIVVFFLQLICTKWQCFDDENK